MEAYLDNSATTQCSQEAADLMMRLLRVDYGNPSSLHNRGMEAENYVKEARKRIAQTLKVNEKEIYFTSGGSESNNLAIVGSALANKRSGMHVITTAIILRWQILLPIWKNRDLPLLICRWMLMAVFPYRI